ncbi:amino acid adenylation domain-containing protein/thioester reductase domain-containing protein [Clostridium sp. DSM 8431]|uniref:non-ribosomal peptide synthetase n=1 Tax=Clostridium sp. DSM 8431 TaxID=1761781 RepID=UPI0008EEF5A4|nr:non-ribosomal peptide synthetase [Clostridium sp. DSM 8431]SFU28895.1 amino acid adenylation domain-containing protein/thioester reductase domain-containing protein [Clostridium sp. DSM 8431]
MEKELFYSLSKEEKIKVIEDLKKLVSCKTSDQRESSVYEKELKDNFKFKLSDIQESFLVGKRFGKDKDNVGCHMYFEFTENNLNIDRLNNAWNILTKYHKMLNVVVLPDRTQQVKTEMSDYKFKIYDVRGKRQEEVNEHLEKVRDEMSHKLYNANDWPLFEISITKMDNNKSIIHFSIDEWIIDGYSLNLLMSQWKNLYENEDYKLPDLKFTFKDYLDYLSKVENSPKFEMDLEYWMNKFKNNPSGPILPLKKNLGSPINNRYYKRKRYKAKIEKEDWNSIDKKAKELGVSETAVVLMLFGQALGNFDSNDRFSIITTYFNRLPINDDIDKIVGPFVSTSIFEIDNSNENQVEDKILKYQDQLWNDLDHSSVSGIRAMRELRVRERKAPNLSIPVAFTSMLNNDNNVSKESWLDKSIFAISQTPQVWLDHQVFRDKTGVNLTWDVAEECFEDNFIEEAFAKYIEIIKDFIRNKGTLSNRVLERESSLNNKSFALSDMQQSSVFAKINTNKSGKIYQEFNVRDIDVERLEEAVNTVIKNQNMLKTVIYKNGTQKVIEEVPYYRLKVDYAAGDLENRRTKLIDKEFDFGEWPFFDISVSMMDNNCGIVHFVMASMIADGKSMCILYKKIFELYNEPQLSLKKLDYKYCDYINYLETSNSQNKAMERYWKDKCENLSAGPSLTSKTGYSYHIPKRITGKIGNWYKFKNKIRAVSLDSILLTAYMETLEKWSSNKKFSVVYVNWDRENINQDIDNVIGEFTRIGLVQNDSLSNNLVDKIRHNQNVIDDDFVNGRVSVMKYLRKKLMKPGFSLPVVYTNFIKDINLSRNIELGEGLTITPNVDLDCMSSENGDELIINWDYNLGVFEKNTVENMFNDYMNLVNRIMSNLDNLDSLDIDDISEVKASYDNKIDFSNFKCIHKVFEEKAEMFADNIAVTIDNKSVTYRELNRRANKFANYLRKDGAKEEVLVGICLDRSIEMIVSILAVLKSGAAYVPIDPYYPDERINIIIEDSKAPIVITEDKYLNRLNSDNNTRIICVDREKYNIQFEDDRNLITNTKSNNAAYVIYTSGSTGKPKGVVVCHYNVYRLFKSTDNWYNFNENDVWTMFHSYAFDFSVWEIWGALLYGGKLVVVPYSLSRTPDKFYKLVIDEKVTVLNQTPTAFKQFIMAEEKYTEGKNLSLRYVIFGGEALNPTSLKNWFERHGDKMPQLVNMYGITETTVHVTYRPLTINDMYSNVSVIGTPIKDLNLYILDENMNQVPVNTEGELYVSGLGVARGYLNRPQLTCEKFLENKFSDEYDGRLYRTGDVGRYLPNGDIEYLGRCDSQVKIRGFRMELGDIESCMMQLDEIVQCVVTVQDKETGDPKIVAYIIPKENTEIKLKEIRRFLRTKLPDYMVPNYIVKIDKLPLTQNGKLDKSKLPWPAIEAPKVEERKTHKERFDITKELIQLFKDNLMSDEEINKEDDIFDLGSTSITIMTIIQVLEEKYNISVPIEVFLDSENIGNIAEYINKELDVEVPEEENEVLYEDEDVTALDNTEISKEIIQIFKDELETSEEISIADDIFDLGSTSITLMNITQILEEKYNLTVPIEVFLDSSNIEEIVNYICKNLSGKNSSKLEYKKEVVLEEKNYKEDNCVVLEAPKFKGKAYLRYAIKSDFSEKVVSFESLSGLLSMLRMKKIKGERKYLYPSSGGRNAVQTYVYVKKDRVENLKEGIYYYHPIEHKLYLVNSGAVIDGKAHHEFNRKCYEKSAFTIFFIAQLKALKPIYINLSNTLSMVDTGYMTELLLSRQSDYKIGLCPADGFDFERVKDLFKLYEDNRYVYSLMGGYYDDNELPVDSRLSDIRKEILGGSPLENHFLDKMNYETVEDLSRIQNERKFNILSKRELVQITKQQLNIRKFTKDAVSIDLVDIEVADKDYILRYSQREYSDEAVSYKQFNNFISLLESGKTQNGNKEFLTPPLGVDSVDIYIYVKEKGVESLGEGTYKYDRAQNSLIKLNDKLSIPIRKCHTPFNIAIAKEAKFFIFIVSRLEESRPIFKDAVIKYSAIEAGMIGQLLQERQSEFDMGIVPIGGMDFDKLKDDFGIKDNVYIHSFMCGKVKHVERRDFDFEIKEKEETLYPLSSGQKSLFFVQQSDMTNTSYDTIYNVRIRKKLDEDLFKKALYYTVKKQPLLRTYFKIENGIPNQAVLKDFVPKIEVIDASSWSEEKIIKENKNRYDIQFNLCEETPYRIFLFKKTENDYILLMNIHHIITDFTSTGMMVEDLWNFYDKIISDPYYEPVIEEDTRYFEYIEWQKDLLNSERGEKKLNYWIEKLGGELQELNLPLDKSRPAVQTFKGDTVKFNICKKITEALRDFSKQEKKTLYTVMLTAFNIILSKYSRQDDILVGTTANARGKKNFRDVFGYFINPIVIRSDLSKNNTFRELVGEISKTVYSALNNQDYPFYDLVKILQPVRDMSRSPIFQVTFQLLTKDITCKQVNDRNDIEFMDIPQQEGQFDLEIEMLEYEDFIETNLIYNSDLFNRDTIEKFRDHFVNLLESIIKNYDRPINDYELIDENERYLLIEKYNERKDEYVIDKCIHEVFENQVEKHKDEIALVFTNEEGVRKTLTFDELNKRANKLAHYLNENKTDDDKMVGICMHKGLELVVSVVAVLKAGLAYIPIDPSYPEERRSYIISDSKTGIIIAEEEEVNNFDSNKLLVIDSNNIWEEIQDYNEENLNLKINNKNLAYILYTSGSTGKPKGVKVQHEGPVNTMVGYKNAYFTKQECKVHLQMANYTFDVFVGDFMRSLCLGQRLVICPYAYLSDSKNLYNLIVSEKVEFAEFVPAVMRYLVDYMKQNNKKIDCFKALTISSDSWNMKECREFEKYFNENTVFINAYGVTEASIDTTYIECDEIDENYNGCVPIGRPFVNSETYVLDKYKNLVPQGVPGELCIGGRGVTLGYLNRDDLTAEKFIPNKFTNKGYIYRTGDLVRYNSKGIIEFLGRIDNQIKIRGLRVELGEIENKLIQCEYIKEAVVIIKKDKSDENILVGFYIKKEGYSVSVAEVKNYLKKFLPEYMVPSILIELDKFPTNANDKVDRKALKAMDISLETKVSNYVAPSTDVEKKLATIWENILNIENIGVENNFFDIGGHSFLAIKLINEIEKEMKFKVKLADFLKNPTIKNVAGIIDKTDDAKEDKKNSFLDDATLPLDIQSPWYNPKKILLTGATGHLGVNMLADLLNKHKDAYVYCLVRAASIQAGKEKIEKKLIQSDLWNEEIMNRVVPVIGDLEKVNLGMTKDIFEELSEEIDVIYHNGAYVNFAYPYEILKAANVEGTKEVLRLAVNKKMKLINYISTTSVYENLTGMKNIDDDAPLVVNDKLDNLTGYTKSKWVSEKIIRQAMEKGVPVSIYRPDVVTGSSKNGLWNTSDYASKILLNIIKLGYIPKGDLKFTWIPVDYVSKMIIYISSNPNSLNKMFNLVADSSFAISKLGQWLNEIGYSIKELSLDKWCEEADRYAKENEEEIPSDILDAAREYDDSKVVTCISSNCKEFLKEDFIKDTTMNKKTIERYTKYYKLINLLV